MATKHLFSKEAKSKIKELAESIDLTLMATLLDKLPIHAIPMSTKRVDEDGCIWFLSNRLSKHNSNIHKNKNVHLFYAKTTAMEFLNVYGEATVILDREVITSLYQKSDDTWFEGKDDPNITAIKVEPVDAHYWDTKDNALVSLIKMGIGTITGKKMDLGEEGILKP